MAWTDTTKDYDRTKPLHRINLAPIQPAEPKADGFGYRSGCRSPNDVITGFQHPIRTIARELIRTIPGWVHIKDDKQREMEGSLDRSFQTWTDVPVFQWHRYYDWNFHIVPDAQFDFLRGDGNKQDPIAEAGFQHVTSANSMELEWDCGDWWGSANDSTPGLMFDHDLCWPMTGQFIWATGRWIYDCGHASSFDKTGANEGKMRSELHPVKAVAGARWEAFKFAENAFPVPAIQFMFFSSRFGGYFQFPAINDRDYEFIVDLPDHGIPVNQQVCVGHTMSDPLNTVGTRVLEMVKFVDFGPYRSARGKFNSVDPVVTVLSYNPPQVKVNIPMTSLPQDTDCFGFVLTMGWKDPDNILAKKVKKVTVFIDNVKIRNAAHAKLGENWLVKVGANGRWFAKPEKGVGNNATLYKTQIDFSKKFELFLAEEDSIVVSSHGGFLDLVHDVYSRPVANRTLAGVTDYDRDVVNCSINDAMTRLDNMIDMMASTRNQQNQPLGLTDPGHGASGSNPFLMKGAALGVKSFTLQAPITKELGNSAELGENPGTTEYELNYRIKIEKVPGL